MLFNNKEEFKKLYVDRLTSKYGKSPADAHIYEKYDEAGWRQHFVINRRVWYRYRAPDWRSHGRSRAQPVCQEARLGRYNHPLPEPQTLCRLA